MIRTHNVYGHITVLFNPWRFDDSYVERVGEDRSSNLTRMVLSGRVVVGENHNVFARQAALIGNMGNSTGSELPFKMPAARC